MARAKVVHSDDAVLVEFLGNPNSPEPSTGVIKFPGGHVEVSRCTDGTYWAHINTVSGVNIVEGRIDRKCRVEAVEDMEDVKYIDHIAIRISNKAPHFNPNA